MHHLSLLASFILGLALLELPIGYYTFLRISISCITALFLLKNFGREHQVYSVLLGLILIIFNPILPIYLNQKTLWQPIDGLASLFFLVYYFKGTSKS
jgi:hypothetical protein